MKIAVFNFSYDHWQQSALLDHTIDLLRNGDKVTWVDGCENENKDELHRTSLLLNKFFSRHFGINRIFQVLQNEYPNFEYCKLKSFYQKDDNSQFQIENRIIIEQLVTELRDSKPCLDHNNNYITSIKNNYFTNYSRCSNLLSSIKFDCVIVFNGRFVKERSCWDAAKTQKIKVNFIERFSPQWADRYTVFELPVHSIEYRSRLMIDFYKNSSNTDKNRTAKKWFDERIDGVSQSFTSKQTENFPHESKLELISFFHSSEDELFATDLGSSYWNDQMDFLTDLISLTNKIARFHLVVRLHPNLLNKSQNEIHRWRLFSIENSSERVQFLLPNNPINSYSLIKSSQKVITFGSTIGVEAAYMKRASILAGSAFHQTMGITLNVSSPEELENAVVGHDHANQINDAYLNSLPYGFYHSAGGIKFKNVVSNEILPSQDGDFKYKEISFKKPRLISLVYHAENKIHRLMANKCTTSCTL